MANALEIKDFSRWFIKSDAKARVLPKMNWISVRVDGDSRGYKRLVARRGGVEAFGVFIRLAALAANLKPAGTLLDENGPLSVEDIAAMTGLPVQVTRRGMSLLREVGWLIPSIAANIEPTPKPSTINSGEPVTAPGHSTVQAEHNRTSASDAGARGAATGDSPNGSACLLPAPVGVSVHQTASDATRGDVADVVANGALPRTGNIRELLVACGLEEPALTALADAATVESIRTVWADVTRPGRVRPIANVPGFVANALSKRHKVPLAGASMRVSARDNEAIQRIRERQQREYGNRLATKEPRP